MDLEHDEHLSVEPFDHLENPGNGDVVTIGPEDRIAAPVFTRGRRAATGLRVSKAE